jgi:hypothetical protein
MRRRSFSSQQSHSHHIHPHHRRERSAHGEWESRIRITWVLTTEGMHRRRTMRDFITRVMLSSGFRHFEFTVVAESHHLDVLFWQRTPLCRMYSHKVDELLFEALKRFTRLGWVTGWGQFNSRHSHSILMYPSSIDSQ